MLVHREWYYFPPLQVKYKLWMTGLRTVTLTSPWNFLLLLWGTLRVNLVSFACAVPSTWKALPQFLAWKIPTFLHFSGEQHYSEEPHPALWLIVTYNSLFDTVWCFGGSFGPIDSKLHEIEPCLWWLLLSPLPHFMVGSAWKCLWVNKETNKWLTGLFTNSQEEWLSSWQWFSRIYIIPT